MSERDELIVASEIVHPTGLSKSAFALSVISSLIIFILFLMQAIEDITLGASNPNPAFYLSTLLLPHAIAAGALYSAYADEELFDLETSVLFAVAAVVFDAVAAYKSVWAWIDCTTLPIINNYICQNFSFWVPVFPIIALLLFVLAIAMVVVLIMWRDGRIEYLALKMKINLLAPTPPAPTPMTPPGEELSDELRREAYKERRDFYYESDLIPSRRNREIYKTLHNWVDTTLAALAVIHLIVLIAAASLALFYVDEVAFYRGGYLNLDGIFVGASIGFWMVVSPGWRIYDLILGSFGAISDIIGLVYEFPRYQACFLGTAAPANVIDAQICSMFSWRGEVIPFILLIAVLLDFLEIIFIIVRMVQGSDKYQRYILQRQAKAEATAAQKEGLIAGAEPIAGSVISRRKMDKLFYE